MEWIIVTLVLIVFLIAHFLIKKFKKKNLLDNIKNVSLLIKSMEELKMETDAFRITILAVYKDSNFVFKIGEKVKAKILHEISDEELDNRKYNEKYLTDIQDKDFIKTLNELQESGISRIDTSKLNGSKLRQILERTGSKHVELHKIGTDKKNLFYLSLSSKTRTFSSKRKQEIIKNSLIIIKKLFKDSNPNFLY
jgi:hypothetical protein